MPRSAGPHRHVRHQPREDTLSLSDPRRVTNSSLKLFPTWPVPQSRTAAPRGTSALCPEPPEELLPRINGLLPFESELHRRTGQSSSHITGHYPVKCTLMLVPPRKQMLPVKHKAVISCLSPSDYKLSEKLRCKRGCKKEAMGKSPASPAAAGLLHPQGGPAAFLTLRAAGLSAFVSAPGGPLTYSDAGPPG